MKKNKNQHSSHEGPGIVDMDSLAYAGDADLEARFAFLSGGRERSLKFGHDPHPWEVELAYLQRERDIRRLRIRLHEQYLAKHPDNHYDNRDTEVVDEPSSLEEESLDDLS